MATKEELLKLGKEYVQKIAELREKKKQLEKDLKNPFVNRTLREKYKKEIPQIEKDIQTYKRKIAELGIQ